MCRAKIESSQLRHSDISNVRICDAFVFGHEAWFLTEKKMLLEESEAVIDFLNLKVIALLRSQL